MSLTWVLESSRRTVWAVNCWIVSPALKTCIFYVEIHSYDSGTHFVTRVNSAVKQMLLENVTTVPRILDLRKYPNTNDILKPEIGLVNWIYCIAFIKGNIFDLKRFILCISVFACMLRCVSQACLQKPKECIRSPRARLRVLSCHVDTENQTWVLWKNIHYS